MMVDERLSTEEKLERAIARLEAVTARASKIIPELNDDESTTKPEGEQYPWKN